MEMTTAGGLPGSESATKSSAAFPRRVASWNSIRARLPIGVGPSFAIPTYVKSHVHPDNLERRSNDSDFNFSFAGSDSYAQREREVARTRSRTRIRSGFITGHAAKLDVRTGDLVRVETEIGYYVVRAWVTEGIQARHCRVQSSHGPLENERAMASGN